jgi:hypothetical protein
MAAASLAPLKRYRPESERGTWLAERTSDYTAASAMIFNDLHACGFGVPLRPWDPGNDGVEGV